VKIVISFESSKFLVALLYNLLKSYKIILKRLHETFETTENIYVGFQFENMRCNDDKIWALCSTKKAIQDY